MEYVIAEKQYIENFKPTYKNGIITSVTEDMNSLRLTQLEIGMKINVRDYIYKQMLENGIDNLFKLNVKRLNRWWYSIYFDRKGEQHG